ncbi:hypothetical protein [Actinomadura flavalba]|uniref:hypothetical protein n=1 Tax=Actinomadura flavalba TaxID=1120938 RepID=UPI00036E753A|nr:hypothetical protein [Actinomadura flavalba]
MDEAEASAHTWRSQVHRRGTVEQNREALSRLIKHDPDPFEVELYELTVDPRMLLVDRAQRRRAGQYERHLRRLKARRQHRQS